MKWSFKKSKILITVLTIYEIYYRIVLKLTGVTPAKYITKKKLAKAKEMLEVGVFPTVKETAFELGFERPEHFTKLFRKEFGILPSIILKG